jgi:hypothetical protein
MLQKDKFVIQGQLQTKVHVLAILVGTIQTDVNLQKPDKAAVQAPSRLPVLIDE